VHRRILVIALAAAALAGTASAAVHRPPAAAWSSQLTTANLVAGRSAVATYSVSSDDSFVMRVTLVELSPTLRIDRGKSTPFTIVGGKPTWTLRFAQPTPARHSLGIRIVFAAPKTVDRKRPFCLGLRQVASNGGVPDVVPIRRCAR
jgi:hypothetical protein